MRLKEIKKINYLNCLQYVPKVQVHKKIKQVLYNTILKQSNTRAMYYLPRNITFVSRVSYNICKTILQKLQKLQKLDR